MDLVLDLNKRYTYADYLTWIDDKSRELINGFIKMFPSPLSAHARITRRCLRSFEEFIENNGYGFEVFHAPFDVILFKGEYDPKKIDTVVQPDVFVVCDTSKIQSRGCFGTPDLIIEVLSSFTSKRDLNDKFNLYQEYGVKEYWVVYPQDKQVQIFLLKENGKFNEGTFYESTTVSATVIPRFQMALDYMFSNL